ncbi:hypothetical protein QZH41_004401 [Actinostola sp. cb2023]|nr:hypothetical protein QZH41_004401 [Actinostola sp. cb2023]
MNFTINSTNVNITNATSSNVTLGIPPNPHYRSRATIIAQVTSLAILGVVIVLSNLASIATFIKNQSLRKRSNYLIINLSVSDFLIGIVAFMACPFFLGEPFSHTVEFRFSLEISDTFTGAVSLLCLTLIAVERFHAVVYPFRHRMLRFKHYVVFCLIPWLLATTIVVIFIGMDFPTLGESLLDVYTFLRFTVLFLALVVMIVSYVGIWLRSRQANPSAQNHNHALRDQKLSVTLFAVTLASLLTWLPIQCFSYALYFFDITTLPHFNYFFAMKFLQFSNSGINFFIYIFRMREFKAGFLALFHFRRKRTRSERTSSERTSRTRTFNSSNNTISIRDLSLNFSRQRSYTVNGGNDVINETECSLETRTNPRKGRVNQGLSEM